MAIGDGFGQLLRPVGSTPVSSGVTTVGDRTGDILQGLGQEIENRARPALIDQATQEGAQDGAAGTIQNRGGYSDWDVAYTRAATAAASARADTERDDTIAELASQFADDPQGFEAALAEAQTAAVQAAPERLAVRIEQGWQRAGARQLNRIRARRVNMDAERARGDVQARQNMLQGQLQGFAREGQLDSEEAREALAEWDAIVAEKTANPVWEYGAVEAQRDRQLMSADLASLTAGRAAVAAFEAAVASGQTLAGAQAASRQALLDRFSNDPALSGLTETERTRMLNAADNALAERVQARRQEITAQREEERQAQREIEDRHEANFNRFRTAADSGGMSEAQINAAQERGELNATQADVLRSEVRAAQARARAEQTRVRADADRAAAERRRAEADVRRVENERRRDAAAAQREAAREAREARREQREAGAAAYFGLQDLVDRDPGQAVEAARELGQRGILDRNQVRSIERSATSENRRDYSDLLSGTRRAMRGAPARQVEAMEEGFDAYLLANPRTTPEQAAEWHRGYRERFAQQRGAAASPTGRQRTRGQIQADIDRVERDRTMPAAQRNERLGRLRTELRAAPR